MWYNIYKTYFDRFDGGTVMKTLKRNAVRVIALALALICALLLLPAAVSADSDYEYAK